MTAATPKVTLLAGGVGGAKAAEGIAASHYRWNMKVIGNIADDQEFHGLWVSPDIDTLTYSLADLINREHGWGLRSDTNNVLRCLERLGSECWMQLGDMDLATHIYRTEQRRKGVSPSAIAQNIARNLGVEIPIILPTDDVVQTQIGTSDGWLSFQEYFVRERCQPDVSDICFEGAEMAQPTTAALEAIADSDVIVIAPSNPIVSIGPILAIPGIRYALEKSRAYVVAISPIIAGKTVKGPADKMLSCAGYNCDVSGIAEIYTGLIDGLVFDQQDENWLGPLNSTGLNLLATNTLMTQAEEKQALMEQVISFALEQRIRRTA